MFIVYERHVKRVEYLKSQINLIELWECEYNEMTRKDEEFKKFIENEKLEDPINPRDALYGGRTNAYKLHHKCDSNEEIIKYFDYHSLYPTVQKQEEYPVDHPEIITTNFQKNLNNYFGLIKCLILPPRKLLYPVLPLKINNKLIFSLCYLCAKLKCEKCNHSDDERVQLRVHVAQ